MKNGPIRNAKNWVGAHMPNVLRRGVAAAALAGGAKRYKDEGNERLARIARKAAKDILTGKRPIPRPSEKNRVMENFMSFNEYLIEVKRDEEKAMKLWGYLTKRHEKYKKAAQGHTKLSGYDVENAISVDRHYNELNRKSREGAFGVFMKAPVSTVPVNSLKVTQRSVRFNKREKWKMSDDDPIFVLKKGGKHLVVDGHHRVVAWKMQGRKHIKAHVIDLDKE